MKGYSRRYSPSATEYRTDLKEKFAISESRIRIYREKLMMGISALKPAEYERLLDEYRAELIRHDRLERENMALEHKRYLDKDLRRLRNQENRERINY